MGMRGQECGEEWGGTALASQRWPGAAVGLGVAGLGGGRLGDWGLGRRRPLVSAAGARAVGCGAPARDDFGAGGIGRW